MASSEFDDKDLAYIFNYMSERLEMSITGEWLEIEMLHGVESLPAGRQFSDAEKQFLMLGAQYGARHLVQMQLTDPDVNAAVKRAVLLSTGRAE